MNKKCSLVSHDTHLMMLFIPNTVFVCVLGNYFSALHVMRDLVDIIPLSHNSRSFSAVAAPSASWTHGPSLSSATLWPRPKNGGQTYRHLKKEKSRNGSNTKPGVE